MLIIVQLGHLTSLFVMIYMNILCFSVHHAETANSVQAILGTGTMMEPPPYGLLDLYIQVLISMFSFIIFLLILIQKLRRKVANLGTQENFIFRCCQSFLSHFLPHSHSQNLRKILSSSHCCFEEDSLKRLNNFYFFNYDILFC